MTTTPTNGAASGPLRDGPTCEPCGTLLIETADGCKCLSCKAAFRLKAPSLSSREYVTPEQFRAGVFVEHEQHLRDLARALGMTPGEPAGVLLRRVVEEHRELVTLRPAIAAFRACYEGLPSHTHTRPVCASPLCDLLPKKNGLCNRCYEQKEGR